MSKRMTVIVDDETYAFLKAESEHTNVSICELVRRAIDWYYRLRGLRLRGLEVQLTVLRRRIFGRRSGVAFDP